MGVFMSKKIFLIELSPSTPSLGKSIVMPRSGILTIASILSNIPDYDVTFLFEPYVGKIDLGRIVSEQPDYILLNGLTTSVVENSTFASILREKSRKPFSIIVGGEHATMFPDHAKSYADYVVLYEGDETVVALLAALEENDQIKRDRKLSKIPGLVYKDSGSSWHQSDTVKRVKTIDYQYDFHILPGARDSVSSFRLMQLPLQTSRGCLYNCSFCSWISLFGKGGFYVRPIEDVLYDIEHAMGYTGIQNFMVVDNLFAGNPDYAKELLSRIAATFENRPKKPSFTVLCRADQFSGGDCVLPEKFMKLMKKAGVTHVSLGLESVNQATLNEMRKRSNISLYEAAAARLHQYELNIAATFVTGHGKETYRDVLNIAHFAKAINCFTIQVYCYAMTPKTSDAKRFFYLKIPGVPERFCNGHSVITFPRQMLPSHLQKAVFDTAMIFYDGKAPQKRLIARVYRYIWKAIEPYYDTLKRIESEILLPEGIYISNGHNNYVLHEEKLQMLTEDHERYMDFSKKIENLFDTIRWPMTTST
jgi:radical SAM superfamily enzyme YgiQ (UPF0313 family)